MTCSKRSSWQVLWLAAKFGLHPELALLMMHSLCGSYCPPYSPWSSVTLPFLLSVYQVTVVNSWFQRFQCSAFTVQIPSSGPALPRPPFHPWKLGVGGFLAGTLLCLPFSLSSPPPNQLLRGSHPPDPHSLIFSIPLIMSPSPTRTLWLPLAQHSLHISLDS